MSLVRQSAVVWFGFVIVATAAAVLAVVALKRGVSNPVPIAVLFALLGLGLAGSLLALGRLAYVAKSIDSKGLTVELAFGDLRVTWESVDWYRPMARWWWLTGGGSYVWVLLQYRRLQANQRTAKLLLALPEIAGPVSSGFNTTVLDEYIPKKRKE